MEYDGPTDWIGETFVSDAGWAHLERLVDLGNRMAGSDGERRAAEATRDALAEHARNARLEEFDIQGWTRGTSAVETPDTTHEGHEVIALPRSPSGEASGALLDLGHGLPEDFEDGAVAFLFRNHVEGGLAPTGSVGTPEAPIGDMPAVGVSKEVGARLARRAADDEVTVRVDCEAGDATSQNVHAELGPDTEERLLVTSHVDAHDIAKGAMDNGAGTAVVVELARALATREADLETRVEFVCFGAEEVGLLGSHHHADRVDPTTVRAVVNNDGVVRGRTLAAYTHGFPALRAAFERVADRFDHPVRVNPELGPHSDHWPYVTHGIPGTHVHAETEGRGRGWGHTAADTLDKLESRDLRESAVLLTALVVDLARADRELPHRDPVDIAADAAEQDLAEGLRVTGDWPETFPPLR
ncbi:peptidase M28 [Halobacteriales archaeon QS_4_70_19]|nr:MAG: peptidase M28 [Halobacteriales archaeon QS_4_70_19]